MVVNEETKNLIKHYEGCRLHAYPDPGTGGEPWTIGFGHTGPEVHRGMVITQAEADKLFEDDLSKFASKVNELIKVPVTSNQFGACVSLAYNIGIGAFENSTLLRKLNVGDYKGAANEFSKWCHAGGKALSGLVDRRKAEQKLFESDSSTPTVVPTSNTQNPLLAFLSAIFNYFIRSK